MMVYKAVCITTLLYGSEALGYLLMSSEDPGEIKSTLPQKDTLYPMGKLPHQCQYPHVGEYN